MANTDLSQFPPLESLHIDHDFIFMLTMQNKKLCKRFAEILLDIKIKDIKYSGVQKSKKPFYMFKSVRFDALLLKDDKVINIEMQASHYENLLLRARYYQSMIDATQLKAGKDYEELQDTYLLFLCKDDPFYKGLPIYTIKPYCEELLSFAISDRTQKKFFSCKFYEKVASEELKALMQYIYTHDATNEFTKEVDAFIEEQKKIEEVIMEYGSFNMVEMDARRLGKKEGLQAGMQAGMQKGIQAGMQKGMLAGRMEGISLTAKSMLKDNLDIDKIARYTGLSLEQIRALQ